LGELILNLGDIEYKEFFFDEKMKILHPIKLLIPFLFLIISLSSCRSVFKSESSNYQEILGSDHDEKITKGAQYPNGFQGVLQTIKENFSYPKEAKEMGIQGVVILEYIVEKNGSIEEVRVLKSAHPILDKDAIRIIKTAQNWKPAKVGEKAVRIKYKIPIKYQLR
jgi:protein TonB